MGIQARVVLYLYGVVVSPYFPTNSITLYLVWVIGLNTYPLAPVLEKAHPQIGRKTCFCVPFEGLV